MSSAERQLAEALRQLRKSTGVDWEKTIALRAKFLEEGGRREVCPKCLGSSAPPLGYYPCDECDSSGEVYVP